MKSLIRYTALGFGLAIGTGLIYALFTSEMARLVIFGLFLFILGASIVGLALLLNNRQWTHALGMWRPPSTNNRYQLLPPAHSQPPNYYSIPHSLPQIEDSGEIVANDDPVA